MNTIKLVVGEPIFLYNAGRFLNKVQWVKIPGELHHGKTVPQKNKDLPKSE